MKPGDEAFIVNDRGLFYELPPISSAPSAHSRIVGAIDFPTVPGSRALIITINRETIVAWAFVVYCGTFGWLPTPWLVKSEM